MGCVDLNRRKESIAVSSLGLESLAVLSGFVQSVPEPARLLLLGIGFFLGGATLRGKFRTDVHGEAEPLTTDGWEKEVKASHFQLRPREANMEVVGD